MKAVGILGGSFDPVHLGHMKLAEKACNEVGLDKVYLVAANIQPFKQEIKCTGADERIRMLHIASAGYDTVEVSTCEVDREGISYTIDTLEYFRKKLGDETDIHFITGADSFLIIDTWYRGADILSNFNIIVGSRPGYRERELETKIKDISERFPCRITKIDNEQVDISSSELRKMLYRGDDVSGYLDSGVMRYIREHGLYRRV